MTPVKAAFIHWFITSVDLKYPDKQLFLRRPVLSIRLFLAEILWQMNKSLRRLVSDFCSRWGVKCRREARSLAAALCCVTQRRSDWTFVIVFAAGRRCMSGSRSSLLVWKISDWARAGHLQLQAFSSQTQKHFGYWRREEEGNQEQERLCCILEGKGSTAEWSQLLRDRGTFLFPPPQLNYYTSKNLSTTFIQSWRGAFLHVTWSSSARGVYQVFKKI